MNKLRVKKKKQNISIKNRKKHVETMFLTNKTKKYPYYFKSTLKDKNTNKNNFSLKRGLFYIKIIESGFITIEPLKAIMRIYKWFIRFNKIEEFIKINLFIFPDFNLTKKPKDMRMGKGKGRNFKKVCFVPSGKNILSIKKIKDTPMNLDFFILSLLKKIKYKLPLKGRLLYTDW